MEVGIVFLGRVEHPSALFLFVRSFPTITIASSRRRRRRRRRRLVPIRLLLLFTAGFVVGFGLASSIFVIATALTSSALIPCLITTAISIAIITAIAIAIFILFLVANIGHKVRIAKVGAAPILEGVQVGCLHEGRLGLLEQLLLVLLPLRLGQTARPAQDGRVAGDNCVSGCGSCQPNRTHTTAGATAGTVTSGTRRRPDDVPDQPGHGLLGAEVVDELRVQTAELLQQLVLLQQVVQAVVVGVQQILQGRLEGEHAGRPDVPAAAGRRIVKG
mmetsp:Transcript_28244/g.81678  ORF Transcript_28244/g.81678 Transcript_28244/m.81678 type:complete len:274 (+) Transcript_28244:2066-2887(+)